MSVSVPFVGFMHTPVLPAAICCSEVAGRDLSSCSDRSAAFLRSGFFRLESEMRVESSLESSVAVMVAEY